MTITIFRQSDTDAALIDRLYDYANALKATEKALAEVACGRNAELDALLDRPTYLGDLADVAVKINAIADAWQDEIDAAPDLLEALEAAYTFISQPQVMHTPADGPKTATYRVEGYNALTARLRAAIAKATGADQ